MSSFKLVNPLKIICPPFGESILSLKVHSPYFLLRKLNWGWASNLTRGISKQPLIQAGQAVILTGVWMFRILVSSPLYEQQAAIFEFHQ